MRRSTLLLTLGVVFLSFGYTTEEGDDISKIYLIDNLLIRTTPGTDIRLYDISNPASVTQLGRIAVDGNSDVAVTDRIMYADRGYDLMVYDISTPSAPRAIDSVRKAFATLNEGWVGWNEGDDVWMDDEVGGMSGCGAGCGETVSDPSVGRPSAESAGGDAMNSGKAGSLARFMIVGDYLYCLDGSSIRVFDIAQPERPRYLNSISVAWGIETIFHNEGELYIGGQEGMYIYSLDDPSEPEYLSEFGHRRSCDPVVVDGDRAYVTLRSGSPCGDNGDQLDILDVSNPRNPKLLKTVEMEGPYGLAAYNGTVMVCDGQAGLKTMRASDLSNIVECGGIEGITAYDVIWHGNLLILTAEEGFWLYDVTDPCNPTSFGRLEF